MFLSLLIVVFCSNISFAKIILVPHTLTVADSTIIKYETKTELPFQITVITNEIGEYTIIDKDLIKDIYLFKLSHPNSGFIITQINGDYKISSLDKK